MYIYIYILYIYIYVYVYGYLRVHPISREVLAVGPRNLQKIVKSCNFYLTKCEGNDKELGAACRLVRELSREVQEQVGRMESLPESAQLMFAGGLPQI